MQKHRAKDLWTQNSERQRAAHSDGVGRKTGSAPQDHAEGTLQSGGRGRSSSARSGLFLIVDKGANAFNNRGLAFFKDFFVFFEKIAPLGVNRADQGAKLFHPHHPHGFGHAEFRPLMVFDLFNTGGGNDGAAAREDAVDCLFFSAARLGVGTHAALADDEFDAGFLR